VKSVFLFPSYTTALQYLFKLNEAKPNTIELKNKIKKYQSFDQYIAKKNNTVQAYEKFWAPIYIILN
jgi:predicted NAD/FAD-binding protein